MATKACSNKLLISKNKEALPSISSSAAGSLEVWILAETGYCESSNFHASRYQTRSINKNAKGSSEIDFNLAYEILKNALDSSFFSCLKSSFEKSTYEDIHPTTEKTTYMYVFYKSKTHSFTIFS